MKEYPKINSIFKRDEETNKFLIGQWSQTEFEYLSKKTILVWSWRNTPEEFRRYIKDQDDIDWVAFIPNSYKNNYIDWLDSESFGCCGRKKIKIQGGQIYIGYHS